MTRSAISAMLNTEVKHGEKISTRKPISVTFKFKKNSKSTQKTLEFETHVY